MMSVKALGKGAAKYFTDYLHEVGETVSRWLGRGSEAKGLKGAVDRKALEEILNEGRLRGEKLLQNAGRHHPGQEVTLSTPKDFGVLYGLADDARRAEYRACLWEATETTVRKLEEVSKTRRGKGGHTVEPVAGLFVAGFFHETSRPVKGHPPDPNPHVHLAISTAVLRQDGTTGALLGISRRSGTGRSPTVSPFYDQKLEIGAHFREALAQSLERRMGLTVHRTADGFTIDGVDPKLSAHFSKRRTQIVQELARTGETGGKAAERATLRTRGRKAVHDPEALREHWRNDARRLGLEPARVLTDSRAPLPRAREERVTKERFPEPGRVEPRGFTPPRPAPAPRFRSLREALNGLRSRLAFRAPEPKKIAPRNDYTQEARVRPAGASMEDRETRKILRGTLLSPVTGVAPVSLWRLWRSRLAVERGGTKLSSAERRSLRRGALSILRRREMRVAPGEGRERVIAAATEAFRKSGYRVHVVTPSRETAEALSRRGVRAYSPRFSRKGMETKRTWRETFHIVRGETLRDSGRAEPGSPPKRGAGGRIQFRSLGSFLKYAETTKNRAWFSFDRKTVLIIENPDGVPRAELSAIAGRAHRKGATVVAVQSEPPRVREPEPARVDGRSTCRS